MRVSCVVGERTVACRTCPLCAGALENRMLALWCADGLKNGVGQTGGSTQCEIDSGLPAGPDIWPARAYIRGIVGFIRFDLT